MSSGFVSELEIAEKRRVRQEEWEKVRQPSEPIGNAISKLFLQVETKS